VCVCVCVCVCVSVCECVLCMCERVPHQAVVEFRIVNLITLVIQQAMKLIHAEILF